MSSTTFENSTGSPVRTPREAEQEQRPLVRNWRTTITFSLLSLVLLVLVGLHAPESTVVFRLSDAGKTIHLGSLSFPAAVTGWGLGLVCAGIAVLSAGLTWRAQRISAWIGAIFWFCFVVAMLIWTVGHASDNSLYLPGLLGGSLALAVPLIFGSMSGLLCERSGVVNIAIEGQLLLGAFAAALVGTLSGSAWVGLIAAMIGGMLVSLILASFSIRYLVNQVIVGVVVNVLVTGLTGFLYSTVLQRDADSLNAPPRLPGFAIPGLSEIPVIGPVLFDQSVLVYLMYAVVFLIWFGLTKTPWGLRTRAVGEHPQAADTLGITVNRLRFSNVLLAGAVAGMGGAFFTLVSVSAFNAEMTAGQGYIALAALIFGRWRPIGALGAALLFGFATNLQSVLSLLGTSVPSQLLAMLPYLVTIAAVTGLVGRSRGPAAAGQPYVKE